MLLTNSLIWDLLSTLRTIWTTKSTNELERLRLTSGDFVLGFGKITTSQSNWNQGLHRLHPECSVIQQRDVVHTPPPRKPAQCILFKMSSLHSWCLMKGSCTQLYHPASHRFIWPHYYHKAETSALARPRPSYGRWSPAQGYPLRWVL